VILTSNRTREVHDALKRRCIYHWIDYPSLETEQTIVALKVPGASERLARQVSSFIHRLRDLDLYKQPGVAESLDWARALVTLGQSELQEETVRATLGCVLKYEEDLHRVQRDLVRTLVADARH
jgi:MoxR-like ATPase